MKLSAYTLTLLSFAVTSSALPDQVVVVETESGKSLLSSDVLSACIQRSESTLSTIDANFPKDGKLLFSGCPIESIITKPTELPVTVIASDQYILHANYSYLKTNGGLIASKANGQAISLSRGGPLKLVFKEGTSGEHFIWYTKAILVGSSAPRSIEISTKLSPATSVPVEKVADSSSKEDLVKLPAPRGPRLNGGGDTPLLSGSKTPILSLAPQDAKKSTMVRVEDLGGNVANIPLDKDEVHISCGTKAQPLGIVQGGPCMILRKNGVPFYFVRALRFE